MSWNSVQEPHIFIWRIQCLSKFVLQIRNMVLYGAFAISCNLPAGFFEKFVRIGCGAHEGSVWWFTTASLMVDTCKTTWKKRRQVTHIQGETGCGKSTRLPQFILEARSWSYSCFFTRTPPSSRGILKRFWKQIVMGSSPAGSLGNLYSAYQNPISHHFPGSYEC